MEIRPVSNQVDDLLSEINKRVAKKVLINAAGGFRRENLDSGNTRDSWFLALGFEHLF